MGYKNLKLCSSLCKVQIMDDDDDVWSDEEKGMDSTTTTYCTKTPVSMFQCSC